MLGKKRKLGKKIKEIQVGDSYENEIVIKDRDLLLYLGLTNDANPLYIQHDYASQTPFERPIVPSIMVYGMVSASISMHLPGPGSHVVQSNISYPHPVYHYEKVKLSLKVEEVNVKEHFALIKAEGKREDGKCVLSGVVKVCPAYEPKSMNSHSLDNFY
ncbi:MaoC/PaaZ C-terminal domain-containing protein [Bacillaceae bacterium S4-13-56]